MGTTHMTMLNFTWALSSPNKLWLRNLHPTLLCCGKWLTAKNHPSSWLGQTHECPPRSPLTRPDTDPILCLIMISWTVPTDKISTTCLLIWPNISYASLLPPDPRTLSHFQPEPASACVTSPSFNSPSWESTLPVQLFHHTTGSSYSPIPGSV